MAKNKKNFYRQVDKLPSHCMSVSEYAKSMNYTTPVYVYKLWKNRTEKKPPFEIVEFKGINFIIPQQANVV